MRKIDSGIGSPLTTATLAEPRSAALVSVPSRVHAQAATMANAANTREIVMAFLSKSANRLRLVPRLLNLECRSASGSPRQHRPSDDARWFAFRQIDVRGCELRSGRARPSLRRAPRGAGYRRRRRARRGQMLLRAGF